MKLPVIEVIGGSIFTATFVSSGAAASPICSTLWSGSETLVSSLAAVDSGDGHYYAQHPLPDARAWYVNRWIAVINANTYVAAQLVKAHKVEVD